MLILSLLGMYSILPNKRVYTSIWEYRVLWCCGGICHEVLTFIQIGCGHTVSLLGWQPFSLICNKKNSYLRHCLVPLVGELFLENQELNIWHQLSYGNSQSGQNVYITICFTLGFTNFRGPSQETWYQKGQVINTLPC